jgi:hypothetical protein
LLLGVLSAGAGALCLGRASDEWQAYQMASSPARTVPLRALLETGPGENRHVIVTDFTFYRRYVYLDKPPHQGKVMFYLFPPEEPKKEQDPKKPLVLDLGMLDPPCLFYLIAYPHSEEGLQAVSRQDRVEGVVSRWTPDGYGDLTMEGIEGIPRHVSPRCLVLEQIRPATKRKAVVFSVLCATLLAAGGVSFFLGFATGVRDLRRWKKKRQHLLEAANRATQGGAPVQQDHGPADDPGIQAS